LESFRLPPIRPSTLPLALSNLPIIGLLAAAALLLTLDPDRYHRAVQEDEILEWVTFWSFVGAAAIHGRAAFLARAQTSRLPWFLAGLGLFCLLVALEEISWGQRLLGYRPPGYFLAENYQQELNFHNTLGDELRQGGFLAVVWGYGVVLPLIARLRHAGRWIEAIGIVPPAIELVPSFAATAIFYQVYPWSHSGEWAEAMLGTAMLFVALDGLKALGGGLPGRPDWGPGRSLAAVWLLAALLGAATTRLGWLFAANDSHRIEAVGIELAALREDIAQAQTRTRCGMHKRLYTMVEAYRQDHLYDGAFASLQQSGLPSERARYFLDPWNSPYWIQHVCSEDHRRRAIFVYSFGPNRMRDSTDWEIGGDDAGAWISRPRVSAGD
jgi:hypothetical protein